MFINMLKLFIGIVFDNGETDPKSKNFKPLKIIIISLLVGNVYVSYECMTVLSDLFDIIEKEYPELYIRITTK